MARKTWDTGNLFAVPLQDGSYALGQVVGREAEALNSITCVWYRIRKGEAELASVAGAPDHRDAIAVQFTTKDLLTRRVWKVLGNYPVTLPQSMYPHGDKRGQKWVGATIVGSGNVVKFLNAFFGLAPWDQMKDPHYFDRLLLREDLVPRHVRRSA